MTKLRKSLLIIAGVLLIIATGCYIASSLGYFRKTSKPVETSATPSEAPTFKDFHLVIPSLDISAPIIADVDGNNKDAYFKALQGGVAHYKGTSKPGEKSNVFIFGHSSYYIWDPGKYKEIFKKLDNIKKDDIVTVWWQGKKYDYTVTETKIVEPTETSVLNQTKSEQLTLMTCYPPGTTKQRFIVVAKPTN